MTSKGHNEITILKMGNVHARFDHSHIYYARQVTKVM